MVSAFDGAIACILDQAELGLPPEAVDIETLQRVRAHLASHGKHLLHLSRASDGGAAADVDLGRTVADTVAMLRSAGVLRHAEVALELPATPLMVRVDRTRIEQVAVNLVKNAIDAMEDVPDRRGRLVVTVLDDRGACCRISDNGTGIPADRLTAIFEPYYTTKPRDRGTGLGLFVVKQIIEAAGGTLAIQSELGRGTTFTIQLPKVG
jgi:signal transduction histidine kinase